MRFGLSCYAHLGLWKPAVTAIATILSLCNSLGGEARAQEVAGSDGSYGIGNAEGAQTGDSNRDTEGDAVLDDLVNSIAEELDEEGKLDEAATEGLAELRSKASNPINLSTATEKELAELIFLDERKARSIIMRRQRAGGLITPQELMTIRGLSPTDIIILRHISTIGERVDTSTLRPVAKIDAIARLGRRWPLARGYAKTDSTEAKYAGSPYKSLFRIKAEIGGRLTFGIVGDNDSGEPQLRNGSGLMDFYGGYAQYIPARGPVRRIVAGNYAVRLGQGLGIWTGFGFSPTITGVSAARIATGITPSMSAAESDYMRGIATEIRILPVRMALYASWVDADATTKTASDSSIYITTIRTTGYHRTATERSYRHNDQLTTLGAYASSDIGKVRVGAGINNWHTSKPLGYNGQLYRLYYPTGKNLTTASLDARVYLGRAHIYGEVATQGRNATGATLGIDISLGTGNSISAAIRRFGKSYFAQIQQPVSRTSRAGSESGVYFGFETAVIPHLNLRANIDIWKLRWLQSNTLLPTTGWSARVNAECKTSRHTSLSLRIRHTDKGATYKETVEDDEEIIRKSRTKTTSSKLIFTAEPTRRLNLSTLCERTHATSATGQRDAGTLVAQTLKIKTPKEHVTFSGSFSYFNTDSYSARTYTRRPMVLYDMAFATCSGEGVTGTAMLTLKFAKTLKLWLWCTQTRYFDRNVVGTSYEQTQGPRRTDVKVQLQWKLWWHKQRDYFGVTKL